MPRHLAPTPRVVLLPTGRRDGLRPAGSRTTVIRRYRLARVASDAASRAERFGHLKHAHD